MFKKNLVEQSVCIIFVYLRSFVVHHILNMREPWVYLKAAWKDPVNSKKFKIREREGLMNSVSFLWDLEGSTRTDAR